MKEKKQGNEHEYGSEDCGSSGIKAKVDYVHFVFSCRVSWSL
jgi:hypothetical protein